MILKRLSDDILHEIRGKKLVCYMCVPQYLEEMERQFGITEQIDFIVDDFARRRKDISFSGRKLCVKSPDSLIELDYNEYVIVITSEFFFEVFDKLNTNSDLNDKMETVYFFADKDSSYYLEYNEFYKSYELENILIFRSGDRTNKLTPWKDFDDNSRALFEYMISSGDYSEYKFVWLVDNPEYFSNVINEYGDNVVFISYNDSISDDLNKRDIYYYYLCLAKYIFFTNNASFARLARPDQIRVQLWHGQGFKARGIDVSLRNRCEYMPVMSECYKRIHKEIFDLCDEQVIVTGIPKQDWVLSKSNFYMISELGIPKAEKYIFWLPTVRKMISSLAQIDSDVLNSDTGLSIIETNEQLIELNRILKSNNTVLVIKPHPSQDERRFSDFKLSNIVFLSNVLLGEKSLHINKMMYAADALISDYSSVAVDYLLLDRPIGFAVGDINEYKADRGFVFTPIEDWLPGAVITDFNQFCEFVIDSIHGRDSFKQVRHIVAKELVTWRDTNNCSRLLEKIGL